MVGPVRPCRSRRASLAPARVRCLHLCPFALLGEHISMPTSRSPRDLASSSWGAVSSHKAWRLATAGGGKAQREVSVDPLAFTSSVLTGNRSAGGPAPLLLCGWLSPPCANAEDEIVHPKRCCCSAAAPPLPCGWLSPPRADAVDEIVHPSGCCCSAAPGQRRTNTSGGLVVVVGGSM